MPPEIGIGRVLHVVEELGPSKIKAKSGDETCVDWLN